METVLVVGSTGNIGVSAVTAALRSNRKVLAIVRNSDSASKLINHIGSSEGITFVEADVLSETGVKGVVEQVREGRLPAFQHVWSRVGGGYADTPLKEITTIQIRTNMNASFEANLFAYQNTINYLLSQSNRNSTWTLCTGSMGDIGTRPMPAITQGALYSMALVAARENQSTNVRFNEVYLGQRVEFDEDAVKHGVTKASDFAKVFEMILADARVRSARVRVEGLRDLQELRWERNN